MKNLKFIYLKITLLSVLLFAVTVSCEREISDEIEFATASTSADVFIDGFSGGLDYYPYSGSKATAFSVDEDTKYSGTASMRFDVPTEGDSGGAYAGASFIVGDVEANTGGRNLTNYDALTFYAKATQAATLDNVGFGQDFNGNEFEVTLQNVPISTNWVKYIIPIPDAYKLTLEKGMFWYSEGPEDGKGYTFWIDDLKFEKLGTIAQPQPAIFNGLDVVQPGFKGGSSLMTGLTQTFNLATGENLTVIAAPSYYIFSSTDVDIARVNQLGVISIIDSGSAKITATLGSVAASGSLTIEVSGSFDLAPVPTRDPSKVISLYSDTYTNVPVDFFNGYWQPYQTTESADIVVEGNNMINYTNFNFVGNQFSSPTVDASEKSNVHINMYIPDSVPADMDFLITLVDFGADNVDGGGDDTREQVFFDKSLWVPNTWITLEFPITMANKSNIGQIIYENINFSSLSNWYLDNVYFYED